MFQNKHIYSFFINLIVKFTKTKLSVIKGYITKKIIIYTLVLIHVGFVFDLFDKVKKFIKI